MKLTNFEIYSYAKALATAFENVAQPLPVKVNFFIQKNRATLINLAQEIEKARLDIAATFGELDQETKQYIIPSEKLSDANEELNDLFSLEQEVQIYTFPITSFKDDFVLTMEQMDAIMFMIECE